MHGLVAAYLIFCPVATPTQCTQHDQGIYLEKRWCNKELGRGYHPQLGLGIASVGCK